MQEIQDYKYQVLGLEKNKNKYILNINNENYTLFEDTIVKYRLVKGKGFNNLEEILKYNEDLIYINKIKDYCLKYLKSKYDYYIYFSHKYSELDSEFINEILDDLETKGFINDNNYAYNRYISLNNKLESNYFIKNTLKLSHIDNNIIEDLFLNNEYSDVSKLELLINKVENKYKKFNEKEKKNKIIKYLISKGFNYSDILVVLESKC